MLMSWPNTTSRTQRFLLALVLATGLAVSTGANAQVRINEVDYEDAWVEFYNAGNSSVDVSDYQICTYPSYSALSDVRIISGSTTLDAGAFLVVEWSPSNLSTSDGEVGLYVDTNFSSAGSMVDYVEYGESGHTRSSVAVDAGEWESGEYVPLASSGKTLAFFDTEGEIGEEDWGEGNETQGTANDPIPVELTDFEATADGSSVRLTWRTSSETNNAGFNIHHKTPGAPSFETVGFLKGQGTTSAPHTYRETLASLDPGRHVFRLKQVDIDGSYAFSQNVEVRIHSKPSDRLSVVRPTPARQSARLALTVQKGQHVAVEVYDALGRSVKQVYKGRLQRGERRPLTINTQSLSAGLYLVRATSEHFVEMSELVVVR